jgi:hypothetical protein
MFDFKKVMRLLDVSTMQCFNQMILELFVYNVQFEDYNEDIVKVCKTQALMSIICI